ncbi:unnamed protein product [Durusdinium trenchii]|uniref:Uncharacterized protein n=1 Tax=Durusdinium trenchii TaxID=1381693 RepID=A0ABP0Q1J4_9DINO
MLRKKRSRKPTRSRQWSGIQIGNPLKSERRHRSDLAKLPMPTRHCPTRTSGRCTIWEVARNPSHPGSYSNNQAAAEELFRQVFGSSSFREVREITWQNGAFLRPGSIVKVSPDRNLVVASCRKAGIDSTNDALRLKALGKAGRVTKVDHDDNTVKIRVAGVEKEVWQRSPEKVLQSFLRRCFNRMDNQEVTATLAVDF